MRLGSKGLMTLDLNLRSVDVIKTRNSASLFTVLRDQPEHPDPTVVFCLPFTFGLNLQIQLTKFFQILKIIKIINLLFLRRIFFQI